MQKKIIWSILFIFIFAGCQLTTIATPTQTDTDIPKPTDIIKTEPTAVITPVLTQTENPPTENNFYKPITWKPFQPLSQYDPQTFIATGYSLPIQVADAANPEVIRGLTPSQLDFLKTNGFVILQTNEKQFSDVRDLVTMQNGQAFFLTTDNVYHALHIAFDDLLKATEREALRQLMIKLMHSLYQQMDLYLENNQATNLESDLLLARNYLAVAIKLFEPSATLSPEVESAIIPQLDQIAAMEGKTQSALIPGLTDDYGAYRPVGHYAGDPELEAYFQGMTWLGRVSFTFPDSTSSEIQPTRAPLLINMALQEAQIDGLPALQAWGEVYEVTNFMVGPSDDPGPIELDSIIKQVYGANFNLESLANEDTFIRFLDATKQLPPPQINSTFKNSSLEMEKERSWRLMGQRFTIDGLIFQQLITDKVVNRFFPTGLDLAAAYGSDLAYQTLVDAGETNYQNYNTQMEKMRSFVTSLSPDFWKERFYSSWQYAFLSQVNNKENAYPAFMSTTAWGYKEINSLLGSWAQLKHDTILYSKMPEGLGGGGPPVSPATPSYVEPNPDVFYRLAYAAKTLYEGLNVYLNNWETYGWYETDQMSSLGINQYLFMMDRLASYFQSYGDIAVKELTGQPLTVSDFEVTHYCLELIDCMYPRSTGIEGALAQDPIPVIAAVSGWENEVLEAAVGNINRIIVAVPINGQIQLAQGAVLSYYEFKQPRSDRLTDQAWREKLDSDPPDAPFWYKNLILEGGTTNDVLAFRIGDVYFLTKEGYTPPLNLRAQPSGNAAIQETMGEGTYLEIIAGPVKQDSQTWWQVRNLNTNTEGWVLENRAWYARSY